jgi:hypothetical protein
MYAKFIKNIIGVRYTSVKTMSKNCDSDNLKKIRQTVIAIITRSLTNKYIVLFYDESLVSDDSFKRKAWKKIDKKVYIPINRSQGTVNFLLICTTDSLINFWITRKTNTHIVTSFLNESVELINKKFTNTPVIIFLDNCKMHKTNLIREFTTNSKTYLLFNGSNSSKINMAEYLFEKIKRNFRLRFTKNKMENIGKTIDKELRDINSVDLNIAWNKTLYEMNRCMQNNNMWNN